MIIPTFIHVITIYNKHRHIDGNTGKTVTEYKRTILHNCFFGSKKAESLNGNVLSQANSYIVRIPKSNKYIDSYKWQSTDSIQEYFTVSPDDIIVKGEVYDEISDTQGHRVSDLLSKYKPNCFTVKTFSDNTAILYAAHYKAEGV